jgi:hypothetical protein
MSDEFTPERIASDLEACKTYNHTRFSSNLTLVKKANAEFADWTYENYPAALHEIRRLQAALALMCSGHDPTIVSIGSGESDKWWVGYDHRLGPFKTRLEAVFAAIEKREMRGENVA